MTDIVQQNGMLYIISAPSGAGKTSLVKALLASLDDITVSISHTTRQKRPGENDAEDYHFVDQNTFKKLRESGEFIEFAQVFDHYYGTTKNAVVKDLRQGTDVILEIDWQGAAQVSQQFPHCQRIFILPPSRAELEKRLKTRGQDDDDTIARRMKDATSEMEHYQEFDFLIINDEFSKALQQLQAIVVGNRLRIETVKAHSKQLLLDLFA